MVELEIDGRKVQVPAGSMLMDAANKLGIYIPHFCYHKKLSIAANCRMCLVDVEKAPKPLPACATPVVQGMVVRTASATAKQAQKGVMEFLLINHPLDCPICDQGGECLLQDLAVGYGPSSSRYTEPKRVVFSKYLGPLVAAEEMTRCIHCTRCVRFGQEIAGVMELGMAGRGEHSEILAFVDRTVDSELSGNMIDLCPVGALTSRPFRYAARTWELARRKSVSPHDSLGSNLIVQVKNQRVLRVVPYENEDVNECWLSDRDRFSYEGLYAADRLTRPMLKRGAQWREVDWPEALDFVAGALNHVKAEHGPAQIGALGAANSTLEELFLLGKLMRALGSDNVDFRLRQSDFSDDAQRAGVPWLGMKVAEINALDRLLLVGSFLRKDHPLVAARVRYAVRHGAQASVVHAVDDDLLMPLAGKAIVAPDAWVQTLAEIAAAVAQIKGVAAPVGGVVPGEAARTIATSLASGSNAAILLGNAAAQHPHAAQLHAWAQWLAQALGCRFGFLGEAANSVGGYLAGAVPNDGGMNAARMIAEPRRAYLLWNFEPEFDTADPAATMRALGGADLVVAFSPYRNGALEYAHAILPIAPFTETSGTFVNAEGRVQSFNGTVHPLGDARPGWKVLRVLGNALDLPGFDYDTPEAVRAEAIPADAAERLSNATKVEPALVRPTGETQRIADVPIYFVDAIVRRAESLQKTRDAQPPKASANAATLAKFGLAPGAKARVVQSTAQGQAAALLECALDERLPDEVVRVPAAHASTATLGALFGPIALERA
ncbi:MAG: NADH-quinone oxidoreductase subunit NuoG [Pseudomonadota bacterium]